MSEVTSDAEASAYLGNEAVVLILGELNTEAKCATLIATPSDTLTPVPHVIENLRIYDAFRLVSNRRFNVQGLLTAMHPAFVRVISDPYGRDGRPTSWVQKDDGVVGDLASATAGSFLDYSFRHRAIRTLIGEKRVSAKDGVINSIHARLGVLTVINQLGADGASFAAEEVFEATAPLVDGITPRLVGRHLTKLQVAKVVSPRKRRPGKLELAVLPDGSESAEQLSDFLGLVGRMAIRDKNQLEIGHRRGVELITNARALPRLIKRSYDTTGHTGKSTVHLAGK